MVLAIGSLLSWTLFAVLRNWEQSEQRERVAGIAHEQIERLHVSILRSMEVLYSLAALHRVTGQLDRGSFRSFVEAALLRQPELLAVSWNPFVPAAARPALEAAARAEGIPGFSIREQGPDGALVPAAPREAYVPVHLIEPWSANAQAAGYDLNSDASRRLSIEAARDTGQPRATAPINLAQLPREQEGFLVLLPVYQGAALPPATVPERRERLAGFAVAVFKVADLVGPTFRELRSKGLDACLLEAAPTGSLIHGVATPRQSNHAALDVAGRRWEVRFGPASDFPTRSGPAQSWFALVGGLALTALSSASLVGGWKRTQAIARANAALQDEVRIRRQAEATAAAANQAKSDFLASMSHEIRTPLNAVVGYAQLLQRGPGLVEDQRDSVQGILTGSQHLLGLINEILDLAKIEAGRMELQPVDFDLLALGRGLTTIFRPLCAAKRIGLRVVFDPPRTRAVRGDEGKLRQVLINLLGNAVKFTRAGEVCLTGRLIRDSTWAFEVIDTGLGIPAEEQPEIFKPFHQGRGAQHLGGTGLGLAIAQRQVALLGGQLTLQSERGIGSRFAFEISLPPTDGQVESTSPRFARLAPGQSVRALVVDDQAENREVLRRMLTVLGCQVTVAADGEEALGLGRVQPPHIVFLDLLLPDRSGIEVTREWLAKSPQPAPKIVLLTASALPHHRRESVAAGCAEYLGKPLDFEKLGDCLRQHLGVTLVDDEPAPASPEPTPPMPEGLRVELPEPLLARLQVAAELHSTTALKNALPELRSLGTAAESLAAEIRVLMRSYDMDGIQQLLARVAMPRFRPPPEPLPPPPPHGDSPACHTS